MTEENLTAQEIRDRNKIHVANEKAQLTQEELDAKQADIKARLSGEPDVSEVDQATKTMNDSIEKLESVFLRIDKLVPMLSDHPEYVTLVRIKDDLNVAISEANEQDATDLLNELNGILNPAEPEQ